MIKNYMKVALRNIRKNRAFSLINILGLSISLTCLVFILLYVRDEWHYDKFQKEADRVHRLSQFLEFRGEMTKIALTPPTMGPEMVAAYPEVEKAVRIVDLSNRLVAFGENTFSETVQFVGPEVFPVLSVDLLHGAPATALAEKYSVVLSESVAEKLFGSDDPIGKPLRLDNQLDLHVTGVFADYPRHSHLTFNILVSLETLTDLWGAGALRNNNSNNYFTYLLLHEDADPEALAAKFPTFVSQHYGEAELAKRRPILEPLSSIYLYSDAVFDTGVSGNIHYVYLLLAIAFAVLVTACINFVNLSTAQSMRRAKEIGVRKVCGSDRASLIVQFLSESFLLSLIAFGLALVLVELLTPVFDEVTGKELVLSLPDAPGFFVVLLSIVMLAGLCSGLYPAFFLSSLEPTRIFKGSATGRTGRPGLRKSLIVIQFASSVGLIISSLLVYQQLNYLQSKELGYERENIFFVPLRSQDTRTAAEVFKTEVLKHSGVKSACVTSRMMGNSVGEWLVTTPTGEDTTAIKAMFVDEDFVTTFGLELAAGRGFNSALATDADAFLLNRSAAQLFGEDDLIGKEIHLLGEKRGRIIGVLQDFHYQSLHRPTAPLLVALNTASRGRYLAIRTEAGYLKAGIASARQLWADLFPGDVFDFTIMDQHLNNLYRSEQRLAALVLIFTVLSITIACLGLFGLLALIVQQRRKEVGIRKVLGARLPKIMYVLTRELLLLVMVGSLVAWPIAWLVMNRWLQNFAYRIEIGWGVLIGATALALGTAVVTVGVQAFKAALANPVDSLRYE